MKKDFEFLTEIATEFFSKKAIKDTLLTISEFEISGWEKWLQIEFAKYCKSHESIIDWGRELNYGLDKRMSKGKTSCAIDFLIRQKHKQSPLAIEFKQQNSPRGCVKAMLRDIAKVNAIKFSQDDLRGIWCIGVHRLESIDNVKRFVAYHSSEVNVSISSEFVFSSKIGRTDFSFTVF